MALRAFKLSLILLVCFQVLAANKYVREGASGAANGSSWTDAWTNLPSVLVRGDTYYVAAGAYPSCTFERVSGTNTIYIKKATIADHGTATGWSDDYATGQAVFSSESWVWNVQTGDLDIDGITGSGTNGHGIKLTTTSKAPSSVEPCFYVINGYDVSNLRLAHVELACSEWGNTNANAVFVHRDQGSTNILVEYCLFSGGSVWMKFSAQEKVVVQYCSFRDCGSGSADNHSAGFTMSNVKDWTLRYSVLENMMGTANTCYIEPQSTSCDGIYIYGNVIKSTSTNEYTSQGVLAITSSDIAKNVFFVNNTAYGLNALSSSGVWGGNVDGSTLFVTNNVWINCIKPTIYGGPGGGNVSSGSNFTNGVTFIDAASGNFRLAADVIGTALGSPYNYDADGVERTGSWSVGAYEFGIPAIMSQPPSLYRQVGTSATFTISASGTSPLVYQWLKGTNAITNATNSTYTISSCVLGDAGSYSCTVTNAYGSATSSSATLSVDDLRPRGHIK